MALYRRNLHERVIGRFAGANESPTMEWQNVLKAHRTLAATRAETRNPDCLLPFQWRQSGFDAALDDWRRGADFALR